jgi:hypothetical protein
MELVNLAQYYTCYNTGIIQVAAGYTGRQQARVEALDKGKCRWLFRMTRARDEDKSK